MQVGEVEQSLTIGCVGAGNIGQGLARLARAAGHPFVLSNSRGPDTLLDLASDLGARSASVEDAVRAADVVVLSVPFLAVFELDPAWFAGKVVLDTTNYYPTRDGQIDALYAHRTTTSEMVADHLTGAHVVKAFNAIMAGDLVPPFGLPDAHRALPVAGDDPEAVALAVRVIGDLGLDAVDAGRLDESWRFERAKPAYCIPFDRDGLVAALAAAERDVELPHNSWHRR